MRSANNWLAFSLSPHLTIDAADHAPTPQSNGPKVARHSSAENGMAYNGSASSEFYTPGQSEDDGLPMRSDGSLCIMEALSRSHSGDWAQLKTGHGQRSQHLLNAELSRLAGRAPSEQQQISQNQYDSIHKSDHETVPKLEDFLGGASLGGQYSTRSDSQSHNFDNLYFRDINVNLSPYSGGAQQQQQQTSHVPPSFHAYGLQRTDTSSSQQPYDSHSRNNTAAATAAEPNLCHPNVHSQNLLQVALEQHRHPGSSSQGGEMLGDCTRQLPQGPNLSALKTWLQQSQVATPSGSVNGLGTAGGEKQPVGISKASIPTLANLHQSLSLSMSPGSQSSNTLQVGPQQAVQAETSPETRKRGAGRAGSKEASPRKSIDNFGQRTSVFRGVTRHRWTGRYEAHLWDNSCRKEGQTRKGRQVYLGGYDKEEKAARAYDLAALKYWGANTTINFPLHQYEKEVEEMKNMTRQEYVASLRRKSSGFSRGASVYRGVTRHHQHGRWQARIGRVAGNKDLYLGTYSTQEEAAEAYDIAAIKFRGINAVTNFDISRYDTKRICGTAHNPGAGDNTESSAAAPVANINKLPLPIANPGSSYGQVVSAKELQLVVLPEQQQQQQQRSEVSVDQTDDDSQSLQTGNTSQATDGGLVVSRTSQLQEWQMLYQQQAQRSWDDASQNQPQHHHQQQQHHHHHAQQQQHDARTQSLISMTDSKFQQQQDARTQSLISLADPKFQQQQQQQQQDARTQTLMSMTDSKYQQQDGRTQTLMSMTDSKYQQQQQDVRTSSLLSISDSKFQQQQQQDVRTSSLLSISDSKFQQQQHQQDVRTSSLLSMSESKFQQQHQQQQQQDARTQSLMSITDSKFLPSANMHSAVLRNLMGLSDGGGSHSVTENSGGLMAMPGSGHGSSSMLGSNGHGGYGGTQQSPKNNSQLSLRESEDDSSKNSGGGSAYENVMQGDFSRHINMYMSQKQSPPHGSQSSSVTNAGYDSNSLGGSSWVSPQAGLNGRVNLSVGHMPIFAVWNE